MASYIGNTPWPGKPLGDRLSRTVGQRRHTSQTSYGRIDRGTSRSLSGSTIAPLFGQLPPAGVYAKQPLSESRSRNPSPDGDRDQPPIPAFYSGSAAQHGTGYPSP